MQPSELARHLNCTSNTIRRWCELYHPYLSPVASPPKGKTRVLTDLDVRILAYISTARDLGQPQEMIEMHLRAMLDNDWRDLPDVPWSESTDTMIPVPAAAARADEMVMVAILQRDLESTRQQLDLAHQRVLDLETNMTALQAAQTATAAEKHALELQLSQARGEVATLRAQLDAFTLAYGMGRDRPLPLALVVGITALLAVLVVLVVFVVARLLL